MGPIRKKSLMIIAALLVLALLPACFAVKFDGGLRPAENGLSVLIPDTAAPALEALATPTLVQTESDPLAVYVVPGGPPDATGRFPAARVDVVTGRQDPVVIALGPQSGFVPFVEGAVRVELCGLAWRRPSVYLWRLPEGGGPGVDWHDSATGLQRLMVDADDTGTRTQPTRTLMTRWVFNSGSAIALRSQTARDTHGKYIAVISRMPRGWMLYLFNTGNPVRKAHQM